MRVVFVVLVLLNLLALASIQGWLGTTVPEGEPERLSNQLNPERIVLPGDPVDSAANAPAEPAPPLPTPAETPTSSASANGAQPAAPSGTVAAATPPAPLGCVVYGGLAEAQADQLLQTALAARTELHSEHKTSSTPSAWWVRIPPNGGRDSAERRVAELRAMGITDLFIVNDAGPNQYAVSLGLFKTEAKAQQHLARLQARQIRGAGIATRSTTVHRIEVRGPAAAIKAVTNSPAIRRSGATISECTP